MNIKTGLVIILIGLSKRSQKNSITTIVTSQRKVTEKNFIISFIVMIGVVKWNLHSIIQMEVVGQYNLEYITITFA